MSGRRRKAGRLGPQVEGYRAWLAQRGYTPGTVKNMLADLGQLGLWMSGEGLGAAQLDEDSMVAFAAARRAAGQRKALGTRAMVPLLTYLREAGVIPAATPSQTPLGALLGAYRSWLIQERGLAATTVRRYESTARRFLQEQAMLGDVFEPAVLTGMDVNAFLLRECGRVCAGSAKGRVAELRSVLRFLYLRGITSLRLGTAVPAVGGWRLSTLPPPTMTAGDVQLLLDSCDRSTAVGVRDFAMMTLVARLGLRSVEVARLELGDVDWRAGELVVRGKGRRQDRLPLPTEVGQAVVAYLSSDRRAADGVRQLFLTCRAPRGPIRADLVGDVVERACARAELPRVGPHRMRHALAAELLRHGAGLVAISQVLRHRDLATTALYAKVDLGALRQVAQPWPGAVR
ncbi:MAG: tyrosine-type recombinase/integrase [Acidimicrobiales bacterium]